MEDRDLPTAVRRPPSGISDTLVRALHERGAVRDADAAAVRGDPAGVLEFAHRARDRFTARTDDVRDGLVREGFLDQRPAALVGRVDQHAGDAAGDVEEDERPDLPVRAAKPAREFREQRPGDRRVRFDTLPEVLAAQHEQRGILHCDDVRGSRLVVDESEFAEMLADAEDSENDFAAILGDEHDLDAARANDEQRVAGIILEENDAPLRVALLAHQLPEIGELCAVKRLEEGDGGEKIGGIHSETAEGRRRTAEGTAGDRRQNGLLAVAVVRRLSSALWRCEHMDLIGAMSNAVFGTARTPFRGTEQRQARDPPATGVRRTGFPAAGPRATCRRG